MVKYVCWKMFRVFVETFEFPSERLGDVIYIEFEANSKSVKYSSVVGCQVVCMPCHILLASLTMYETTMHVPCTNINISKYRDHKLNKLNVYCTWISTKKKKIPANCNSPKVLSSYLYSTTLYDLIRTSGKGCSLIASLSS